MSRHSCPRCLTVCASAAQVTPEPARRIGAHRSSWCCPVAGRGMDLKAAWERCGKPTSWGNVQRRFNESLRPPPRAAPGVAAARPSKRAVQMAAAVPRQERHLPLLGCVQARRSSPRSRRSHRARMLASFAGRQEVLRGTGA